MIRPDNIDKNEKKADFKCDEHGGTVKNLNLKTKTKRVNHKGGDVEAESEDLIIVEGSELTPPCNCVSAFPTWDPKNKLGKELGEAKTKADK